MIEPEIEITQETVIEAVFNPGELGSEVLRQAVKEFEKLSPDAKELYITELREKASER